LAIAAQKEVSVKAKPYDTSLGGFQLLLQITGAIVFSTASNAFMVGP
jgi:hypothetical protein